MSNFMTTNQPRVQKIMSFLDVIERSAVANDITMDELKELLDPVTEKLFPPTGDNLVENPEFETNDSWAGTSNPPKYATIRDMAAKADLKDLTYAMAVFINRIDDILSD